MKVSYFKTVILLQIGLNIIFHSFQLLSINLPLSGFSKDLTYDYPATLYSLAYPLDDICPVALHQSNTMNVLNNSNYKMVFTNDNPRLCMIYDLTTKQHSVYRIRKIKPNEKDFGSKMHSNCYSAINTSNRVSRVVLFVGITEFMSVFV